MSGENNQAATPADPKSPETPTVPPSDTADATAQTDSPNAPATDAPAAETAAGATDGPEGSNAPPPLQLESEAIPDEDGFHPVRELLHLTHAVKAAIYAMESEGKAERTAREHAHRLLAQVEANVSAAYAEEYAGDMGAGRTPPPDPFTILQQLLDQVGNTLGLTTPGIVYRLLGTQDVALEIATGTLNGADLVAHAASLTAALDAYEAAQIH